MEGKTNKEAFEEKPKEKTAKIEAARIIRILQTDISGEKQLQIGLNRIKGLSWSFTNALCNKLNLDKTRRVDSLNAEEIKKIENFIKAPELPAFLLNQRKDFDSGKNMHLNTTELELKKDFDIKRLKKIRSYRGLRHALGQPSRGQRTKGHFRKKGKAVGVLKKAKVGKKS